MSENQARRQADSYVVRRFGYQLPLVEIHQDTTDWRLVYDAVGPNGARFDDAVIVVVDDQGASELS